jgi:molecular chaperone DnaJ
MAKDYYETLGVKKTDSDDVIKKAYKKLALKYHPDKASDDKTKKAYEEKFKSINEAYTTLSDKTKRQNYDMGGSQGFGGGSRGAHGFGGGQGFGGGDFADIFSDLFGGGRSSGRSRENLDLYESVTIKFEEAVFGVEKEIPVRKNVPCNKCRGSGAKDNKFDTCKNCDGRGRIQMQQRTPWGVINQAVTCDICEGKGKIPKEKCSNCNGAGIENKRTTVTISIPKGIDNGQTLRISNAGNASKTGRVGDLLLEVHVKSHKVFTRDRFDVHMDLPISFSQAALGDKVKIPTLDNEGLKIKIAKGTESGTVLRLKGKGIPFLDDPFYKGDQFVKIIIKTPKRLSKAQTKLFEELAKLEK